MKKKAIIIGSGIGGLSTAIRLLHNGFDVEIFEKNSTVGGKLNFINHNGFKFDLTGSILMMPNDYTELFSYTNRNYKDYFKLIPVNPFYKCFFYDDTAYSFYLDMPRLMNTLNKICDDNIDDLTGYLDFISHGYNNYLVAQDKFLNKDFINGSSFFNFSTLFKGLKTKAISSASFDINGYLKNKKLKSFLLFQSMYVGISPFNGSSIYNLIPAVSQVNGLYYISGGMYSYIKVLESLVYELGGKITKNTSVENILFDDTTAVGINCNGSAITADLIIANSDYSYTVSNLIKSERIKSLFKSPEKFNYSCSTFILHLGIDKKLPRLKLHNIFINKDFKKNINAPFDGEVSKDPSLYIYCPSHIDNTMAPEGFESMNVVLRVPNLLDSRIKWSLNTINYFKEQIYSVLCKIPGFEDIKKHIIFEDYTTPVDLLNRFNSYGGSAFGLSHDLNQTNVFRPQCTNKNVPNLYFVGSSLHPGNGISMVLKSSKICVDNIINKYNSN